MYPYQAPIPPPPPKRTRAVSARRAIIIYASMFLFICAVIIAIVVSIPHPQVWKGVQNYFGYGNTTESYTVSNNWRISWECTSSLRSPFIIDVYSSKGALLYSRVVSEYCTDKISKGDTMTFSQGGDVIVAITTNPAVEWTFEIQQLE